jgi:hypothetical protein
VIVVKRILKMEKKLILRETLQGSRHWSNYFWAVIISLGGLGFLIVGLSSFFEVNLIQFLDSKNITFFPQGLVMCFYGIVGLLLGLYFWLIIILEIGKGYNEFNRKTGKMTIFRLGFPGKNRCLKLEYELNEIEAISIDVKDGINSRRAILIQVKGGVKLPLTEIDEPLTLGEIEERATVLASFLQVPLMAGR